MKRFSKLFLAIAATAALPACSGSSGDSSASELQLMRVDVASRDDVRRNQAVVLEFGSDVDPRTVNATTIRITAEPLYESPVPGRFSVDGRRVVFQPSLVPGDEDDDPEMSAVGFRENTRYRIELPATLQFQTVMSRVGAGMLRDYVRHFHTTNGFLPDAMPPQALVAASDVRSLSDIVLQFSEPMDPRTFVDADAFAVKVAGSPLAGTLRFDRTLTEARFRPEHDDPQGGSYTVMLTDRLTDLAGNGLANPTTLTMNVSPSTDSFQTSPLRVPHALERRLPPVLQREGDRPLFGREGVHAMALYGPEDVGAEGPELIHGLYLGLTDPVDRTAVFSGLEVALWKVADDAELDTDLVRDLPASGRTVVRREDFFVVPPRDASVLPIRFDQPFEYDGKSKLVVEIVHSGGTGGEVHAGLVTTSGQRRRVIAPIRKATGVADAFAWDVTFARPRPESEIVTEWRAVSAPETKFSKRFALASPSVAYAEDYTLVEFEGARQLDRSGRPIGGTGDFTTDTSRLDGSRFVRARLTLLGELPTDGDLAVDSLVLPPR